MPILPDPKEGVVRAQSRNWGPSVALAEEALESLMFPGWDAPL